MSRLTMSEPTATLPAAPIFTWSRRPTPTRALCTAMRPSVSGVPTWSEYSSGAAPVPPSLPSTTTKSGALALVQHGLADGDDVGAAADAQLDPHRLAGRQLAHARNERHQLARGVERRVRGRA